MQDQIIQPRPSEVGRVESLGPPVHAEDAKSLWRGKERERLPKVAHSCSPSRFRSVATASVLLAPNWQLTERDRQLKQRWQALIAEARGLGEPEVERVP